MLLELAACQTKSRRQYQYSKSCGRFQAPGPGWQKGV